MLRLGIAGCGWAGERHRAAAAAVEGVEVTAVADADAETRREWRSEWGVDAYAGYEALVSEAGVDAVVVALPHDLHEDATVRAARAGVDVLCEKPIARTVAEADRMLDAAADAAVRLVVAESARYEAWTRAVEERLAAGDVGSPVFARYNWLHGFGGYGYDRSDWLNDPERLGGGQWHLNGVHLISPLRGWFRAGGAGDANGCSPASTTLPRSTLPTGSRATSVPRWRSAAGPRP